MCVFRKASVVCLHVHIIICVCITLALATTKTWTQNNNWETIENWDLQRLPCAKDIVKIDGSDGEIFLNSTSLMKELTFAQNNAVVLGDSAELVFVEESEDSTFCKGGEIKFTGSGSSDWFDPHNWKTESGLNDIGLYSQLVPCQYDTVTFPKDASYYVKISKDVTVASISINGEVHNEIDFQQYVSSHSGVQQIQLEKSASFHITGKECQDISGCICDNDKEKDYICSFVPCPKVQCDQPIKPVFGGCCSICGDILLLNFSTGFNKASVEKQIKSYLKEFPEVLFSSLKFDEWRIQIVLWDRSTTSGDSKTVEASRSIRENLLEGNGNHIIAIEVLRKQPNPKASKSTRIDPVFIGSISGATVGFIVVVVVLFVLLFLKRRNGRYDDTINENTANYDVQNPTFEDGGVNPLHEPDLQMATLGFTNAVTISEKNSEFNEIENPMYQPPESSASV